MKMKTKKTLLLLLCCLGMSLFAQPYNLTWTPVSVAGLPVEISVYKTTSSLNGRAFVAYYAIADMSTGNIELRPVKASTALQSPSEFVSSYGPNAYVCINGGYFDIGSFANGSYSLIIDRGAVKANNLQVLKRSGIDHFPTRAAIGVDKNQEGLCAWSTSVGGMPYWYPIPSPNVEGSPQIQPNKDFPAGGDTWKKSGVYSAIGGGPMLVKDGVNKFLNYTTNYELFDSDIFNPGTPYPPRTAVGYRADGKIVFFVCEGREQNSVSRGARLTELAQIMIELGCTNAINLDGGGSTAMIAGTSLINKPSDGAQRKVFSTVMLVKREPVVEPEPFVKMWDFTKNSTDTPPSPDWIFTDNNARDIATDGKYVYIPIRGTNNSVHVIHANTGQLYKTLNMTGVSGGTFNINSVAVTSDNKLLVGNMTTNTGSDPFKIYMYDLDNMDAAPALFFSFAGTTASGTTSARIGDVFTFEGSTVQGKIRLMPHTFIGKYLTWTVQNGEVVNNEPVVTNLLQENGSAYTTSPGSYPRVYAAGTDSVWIKGSGTRPALFVQNKHVTTVGGILKANFGNAITPFNYKGKRYLATVDYASGQANEEGVILDATTAVDIIEEYRTENNFGPTPNVNGTDATAVHVTPTGYKVFFLSATGGVAAYKVGEPVEDTDTQVKNPFKDNAVFVYPNPAHDVAYLSVFAKRITVYSLSGQIISQTFNSQQISLDGLSGLYIVDVTDQEGNSHKIRLIAI